VNVAANENCAEKTKVEMTSRMYKEKYLKKLRSVRGIKENE